MGAVRRIVPLIVVAVSMWALAACGGSQGGSTDGSGSTSTSGSGKTSVALVLPGPANDGGFNEVAFESLPVLRAKLGAKTAYSESVAVPSFQQTFQNYITQGFKVIVGQGFQFSDLVNQLAPQNKSTYFLVNNTNLVKAAPNAAGLNPKVQDAAFLAGYAAGLATRTNKVGAIGAMPFPPIVADIEAYALGARAANPQVEVRKSYLGSLTDVEKGKETARAMASDHVDVIFHVADAAGPGIIEAAKAAGIKAIGFTSDQSKLAPDTVITSMLVDQARAIFLAVRSITDGSFKGGTIDYGLDSGVVGVAPIRALPAAEAASIQAKVDAVRKQILAGKRTVPFIPKPTS
ncbi:MAG: BMP family lipoprotein [Conexibacter sp.]